MRRCSIPLWIVVVIGVAVVVLSPARASSSAPASARLGVLVDNYPFSFRTPSGGVDGFAYELTLEIERVMDLKFERVIGGTGEINGAFREGRLDALQSYAAFPERAKEALFSVPYLTMTGAIFVRADERRITSVEDLRGRRVAVHRGSFGEALLRRAGLESAIVLVGSVEESLQQVSDGKADATLVARLSGLALAHHLGLKNLRPVRQDVPGYQVRYCLAVRRDNPELLAHINEGLAILVRTGRFDELYREWFSHVEPAKYTALEVALAILVGLTIALLVLLWAVVHLRQLQKRILSQQEKLKASEEWHRAVFEGTYLGLAILERPDGAGTLAVRQVNAAGQRLLRLSAAPAPSTPLATLLGPDHPLVGRLEDAATAGSMAEFEYERADKAGWWRVKTGPLGPYTLLSLSDVTEAVRARQQLRDQEQRLMQSQKLEAIGTLAGGVAHDFNNILTSIIGNTELSLLTLPKDRPEVDSLRRVMQGAGRARQLVKQILTFSRRQETSRQPIEAGPIIQETVEFLKSAGRSCVEFEIKLGQGVPPVLADHGQLHQVLMNVGMNAIQAMRGTGNPGRLTISDDVVEFTATDAAQRAPLRAGRYVRIAIQDTGPGIPPQVLPRIFEPFFSTKAPGEGTGLGLSVVHGIMEQHGGAVTVYSHVGRGTRFDLYFPVAEGAVPCAPAATSLVPSGHGEMILAVDDDVDGLRTIQQILLRLGYRVTACSCPGDGLAEFSAHPQDFALVITDLAMPRMTGLELLSHLRTIDPHKPMLLASGFFTEAEEHEAERIGVTRTVNKPLTVAVLNEAIPACLGRPAASSSPA